MSKEKPIVLAVGAHPDDIEFLFGGTLVLLRDINKGSLDIHMITICNGNMGSAKLIAGKSRETRWGEAQKAAALIDAHYDTCDIEDLRADDDRLPVRDILVGQIRQIKPGIVLTHSPNDVYMPDHRVASWVVSDALFCAMLPNYNPTHRRGDIRTRKEKEACVDGYRYTRKGILPLPALYYGDPFPGYGIFGNVQEPTFLVDVSSTMDKKVEMLLCHKSQGAWLKAGHGDSDYIKTAREWSRRISNTPTEAFLRHQGIPYPQDPRLENLLGSHVIPYTAQTQR